MSKQDPADQVKFLVSCIGHTTNGRPDFQAVATELEIVSKAAAQKRYERMLKSHGISTKGGAANVAANSGDEKVPPTPTKRKAKAEPTGSVKKRTRATKKEEDDEQDVKPAKASGRGKMKQEEPDSDSSALTAPPTEDDDVKDES